MWYNPVVVTDTSVFEETLDVAIAQYQFIVASVNFFFALIFLFIVFRFLLWFLPDVWHRSKEQ